MENSTRLYDTIVRLLSQHKKWLDIRHLYTVAAMVVGLIQSETVSLTAWAPYVLLLHSGDGDFNTEKSHENSVKE